MSTLIEMQEAVFKVNETNGWFDEGRAFDDDIALLHSEVSEMFEAYRDWGYEDRTRVLCAHQRFGANYDEHDASFASGQHLCKPEGWGSEAADVLVRMLDTNHRYPGQLGFLYDTLDEVGPHKNFDPALTVGGHIRRLHGIVSYIMLGTSLTPTLEYLVAWCNDQEVDLEAEFWRKLAYNETRGHKHGGKLL